MGGYVCVQQENTLSGHCDMDNGDSTFYPPFPKKTIFVIQIIVIFQNSAHHHLQTTSKGAKSVMLSYFLFITSHFLLYLLQYSIQRYFIFLFLLSTKV